MTYLSVFFIALLIGLLLLLALRSGNPFYDMLRLPMHLYRVQQAASPSSKADKLDYGSHKAQYLLRILPSESSDPRQPVIFFLHGGGWQFGHPRMFLRHGQVLADAGYPVYLLCHRKIPWFGAKALLQDLEDGFSLCLSDLDARGEDTRKIVVWGMSSGGNLGSLLFLDAQRQARVGVAQDRLVGGMFMAAPLDLDQMWLSPPLFLFAGLRKRKIYNTVNPVRFILPDDDRPVLIIHSVHDGIVEIGSAASFFEKRLLLAPDSTKMIVLSYGVHFEPASWVYEQGKVRSYIFEWLDALWKT